MSNQTQSSKTEAPKPYLPSSAKEAVFRMIEISKKLITVCERESQALLQQDVATLSIVEDEKEILADKYMKASEEFRARLEDFRSVDAALLNKLEDLQGVLAQQAQDNNVLIEQMYKKSQTTTQSTLVSVQELAQRALVHLPEQLNFKEVVADAR